MVYHKLVNIYNFGTAILQDFTKTMEQYLKAAEK